MHKISIIGIGYVGLELAKAFSLENNVIGFDIDENKINYYNKIKNSKNRLEIKEKIGNSEITFTSDEREIVKSDFYIIAVPTPINEDKTPNIDFVKLACEVVGRNLSKNSTVILESTVYPGLTEEICIPILEKISNLKCGEDFNVGYSPERINPGDKKHKIHNIVKIVSGTDGESTKTIASLYETIIKSGVVVSPSIKIAEASKLVENIQRDVNIAFMNELSVIFNDLNLDFKEILKIANTKWNFLDFRPGLVGGHCISVDPYYLIDIVKNLGHDPLLISSSRKINDGIVDHIVENLIKLLIHLDKKIKNSNILILGITFKKNCSDSRNSLTFDLIKKLEDYDINIDVIDPLADKEFLNQNLSLKLKKEPNLVYDAIILAVDHDHFKNIDASYIKKISSNNPILIDLDQRFNKEYFKKSGIEYWSL